MQIHDQPRGSAQKQLLHHSLVNVQRAVNRFLGKCLCCELWTSPPELFTWCPSVPIYTLGAETQVFTHKSQVYCSSLSSARHPCGCNRINGVKPTIFLMPQFHSCVWIPGLRKPSAGQWKALHLLSISGQKPKKGFGNQNKFYLLTAQAPPPLLT